MKFHQIKSSSVIDLKESYFDNLGFFSFSTEVAGVPVSASAGKLKISYASINAINLPGRPFTGTGFTYTSLESAIPVLQYEDGFLLLAGLSTATQASPIYDFINKYAENLMGFTRGFNFLPFQNYGSNAWIHGGSKIGNLRAVPYFMSKSYDDQSLLYGESPEAGGDAIVMGRSVDGYDGMDYINYDKDEVFEMTMYYFTRYLYSSNKIPVFDFQLPKAREKDNASFSWSSSGITVTAGGDGSLRSLPVLNSSDPDYTKSQVYRGNQMYLALDKNNPVDNAKEFSFYPMKRLISEDPYLFEPIHPMTEEDSFNGKLLPMRIGGRVSNIANMFMNYNSIYDLVIDDIHTFRDAFDAGIGEINNCHRVTIRNIDFAAPYTSQKSYIAMNELAGAWAYQGVLSLFGCTDVLIENCKFWATGSELNNIVLGGCRNVLIKNCTFFNADYAINIMWDMDGDFTVKQCRFIDTRHILKDSHKYLDKNIENIRIYNNFFSRNYRGVYGKSTFDGHVTDIYRATGARGEPAIELDGLLVIDNIVTGLNNLKRLELMSHSGGPGFSNGNYLAPFTIKSQAFRTLPNFNLNSHFVVEGNDSLFIEVTGYSKVNPFKENMCLWLDLRVIRRDAEGLYEYNSDVVDWANVSIRISDGVDTDTDYFEWVLESKPDKQPFKLDLKDATVVGNPDASLINSLKIDAPKSPEIGETVIITSAGIYINHKYSNFQPSNFRFPGLATNIYSDNNSFISMSGGIMAGFGGGELYGNGDKSFSSEIDIKQINLWLPDNAAVVSQAGGVLTVEHNQQLLLEDLGDFTFAMLESDPVIGHESIGKIDRNNIILIPEDLDNFIKPSSDKTAVINNEYEDIKGNWNLKIHPAALNLEEEYQLPRDPESIFFTLFNGSGLGNLADHNAWGITVYIPYAVYDVYEKKGMDAITSSGLIMKGDVPSWPVYAGTEGNYTNPGDHRTHAFYPGYKDRNWSWSFVAPFTSSHPAQINYPTDSTSEVVLGSDYTFEALIMIPDVVPTNANTAPGATIVSKGVLQGEITTVTNDEYDPSYYEFTFSIMDGDKLRFETLDYTALSSTHTLTPGTWAYVAYVKNDTTGEFYYNGTPIGTAAVSSGSPTLKADARVRIGGNSSYYTAHFSTAQPHGWVGFFGNGKIQQVKINNSAKSAEEIMMQAVRLRINGENVIDSVWAFGPESVELGLKDFNGF